jgi:L-alanine-DL-glutamate epimerase-like enolase superfamily enzyme
LVLWDIAGKVANAPVGRLLGGGADRCSLPASLIRYSDPLLVHANVRRVLETLDRAPVGQAKRETLRRSFGPRQFHFQQTRFGARQE